MQAVLITAYKDVEQLQRLVRFFSRGMRVYVHIDRKSPLAIADVTSCGGVAIKRHRVGWGAYAHVLAVLDLLRLATADPAVDYVHVISGQDMPLHPLSWFEARYAKCDEIHGHVVDCSHPSVNPKWYEHRWLSTLLDLDKRNVWVRRMDDLMECLQSAMGIRRKGIGDIATPYKSLVYVSMPAAAARYVLEYYDTHGRFRRDLRQCLIPEEFLFMSILKNSPFADKVTDRDIHYCDWSERNGAYPAYLDESDYDRIYDVNGETEYAFARKVDSKISAGLVRRIWEKCDA